MPGNHEYDHREIRETGALLRRESFLDYTSQIEIALDILLAALTLALSACGGGSAVLVTETANPAAACADLVTKAQLSGTIVSPGRTRDVIRWPTYIPVPAPSR